MTHFSWSAAGRRTAQAAALHLWHRDLGRPQQSHCGGAASSHRSRQAPPRSLITAEGPRRSSPHNSDQPGRRHQAATALAGCRRGNDGSDETHREIASPRAAHGRLGKTAAPAATSASPDPSLPDAARCWAMAPPPCTSWGGPKPKSRRTRRAASRSSAIAAASLARWTARTQRADPGVEPPVLAGDRGGWMTFERSAARSAQE